ncbi:MAG: hypothetical protein WBI17_05880 [Clostridiaceae bacterium]
MKKFFIGFVSALLLIAFILMTIPDSLSFLMGLSGKDRNQLDFSSPSFNDKTSFYYEYFLKECIGPFNALESEMTSLLDRKNLGEDTTNDMNILEIKVNDLVETPKYHNTLFDPLYLEFKEMKNLLVLAITYIQTHDEINQEYKTALKSYLDEIEAHKTALYTKTISILKEHKILFYIEDDFSITIYD